MYRLLLDSSDTNLIVGISLDDKIIYRFIEELVTNAVKYSSTDDIKLSLNIVNDVITTREWLWLMREVKIGRERRGASLHSLESRKSAVEMVIVIKGVK